MTSFSQPLHGLPTRPVQIRCGWPRRRTWRAGMSGTLPSVSRFVEDIRVARRRGRLPQRFRPSDVRDACPGWADHTYSVFLPKHRRGNPGGYTEYFIQNDDGTYSLIAE